MQAREKRLLIVVLMMGGLYLTVQLGASLVYRPWRQKFALERALQDRQRIARDTIQRLDRYQNDWTALGERTYVADLDKLTLELRKHLRSLLEEQAGLGVAGSTPLVSTYDPKPVSRLSYLSEGRAEIRGQGSLEVVLRAVHSIQRSQRLGRLERLTIKPSRPGALPSRSGDRVTFELSATYVAQWLDQQPPAGKFTVLPADKLAAAGRNRLADWSAYAALVKQTMFQQWQPPVVVVAKPEPRLEPRPEPRLEPRPEPRPHPPAYRNWTVSAIEEIDGPKGRELSATIRDNSAGKSWSVRVGDPLAEGRVVAINPESYHLVLEVNSRRYVVEMGQGRTLVDRTPVEEYRSIRLPGGGPGP